MGLCVEVESGMDKPALTREVSMDLTEWARHLEAVVLRRHVRVVDRVAVVTKTGSTQDLAETMAGDHPGLMLLTGVQSHGRGRLGRKWMDRQGLGLAVTFAIDAAKYQRPELAIGVGLAACRSVEAALEGLPARCGLRWPNDVVERLASGAPGRKYAGVLIEQRGKCLLVGVGINVLQLEADWPGEIAKSAVSLAQSGCYWSRLAVAERLLLELDAVMAMRAEEIAQAWGSRNLLEKRRTTWTLSGQRYDGTVVDIAPSSHIELRLDSGEMVKLDAALSSLHAVEGLVHRQLPR